MLSKALERLLILHEDHEQNASTSTVRLVGSTEANMFASISAGINALYGPLHGGANEAVLDDARRRSATPARASQRFVERVKNKEDGVQAHGLRAPRLQELRPAREARQGERRRGARRRSACSDPLLDIAKELEQVALADDYFIERKLYPNVDFYTGVIYKAMGFPTRMFTVLFAIGRLPGWIAHWREMNDRPGDQDRSPAAALHRERRARYPAPSRWPSDATVSQRLAQNVGVRQPERVVVSAALRVQGRVERDAVARAGGRLDGAGERVAAEQQAGTPRELDGLDGRARLGSRRPAARPSCPPSRRGPASTTRVVADRDADARVRAEQRARADRRRAACRRRRACP